MRAKDLFTIAGFLAVGVAIVAVPYLTLAALGLVVVFALYARQDLWTSAVAALALVPMWAIFSSTPAEAYSTAEISQNIEAGDPIRRAAIILLLLIGLAFIVHRPRELRRVNLLIWMALYITVATVSVLWSQDHELTLRHSVIAVAVSVFSMGVACVYYGRQPLGHIHLVRVICWTSTAACALILALAIYQQQFHIFDMAWRLGSTGHENQISQVAAIGFLAAVLTRTRREIWPSRAGLLLAMGIPALVLLLTKSRTTWLGLLVGIFVAELWKRRQSGIRLAALLVMACALAAAVSTSPVQQLWKRGESEREMDTGSGRIELWQKLWPDVRKHLWLGYGFGAFWSPDTVSAEAKKGQWAATSAHNAYLDMVAQLGLVGLVVVLVLIGISTRNALRLMKYPEYHEIGLTLLALNAAVLAINVGESFLEDIDCYPMIVVLTFSVFVSHRLSVLHIAEENGLARITASEGETP
jgi:exopolysaccharide production protein ExoQ